MPKSFLQKGKDLLKRIKEASVSAVIRMFNGRKSYYQQLLSQVNSLDGAITARSLRVVAGSDEGIDVSNAIEKSKYEKIKESGVQDKPDVVKYREGTALRVKNYVQPSDVRTLAKNVAEVEQVSDALQELDEMITRIGSIKSSVPIKKHLKEMGAFRDALHDAREKLLDTLDDLADAHLPAEMDKLSKELQKFVNSTLPSDVYSGLSKDYAIRVRRVEKTQISKKSPIEFTFYLYIEGLVSEMFKTDELILVLTGVVTNKAKTGADYVMALFLTSLPKFMSPGSFDIGVRLSGGSVPALAKDMQREAGKIISIHGIMPHLGKRKLNITTDQLKDSTLMNIEGILDVRVFDNEIIIDVGRLNKTLLEKEIVPEVIVHLRRIIRAPRKSSFVYVIDREGRNNTLRVLNVNNATVI